MAHTVIDVKMTYYGMFGVLDEKIIVLKEFSELYYKTSTDENVIKIVSWLEELYQELEHLLITDYKEISTS